MNDQVKVIFDLISPSELQAAIEIELKGYPPDEAATLETFQYRQSQAGDLFLGCFLPSSDDTGSRRITGYICSTLTNGEELVHDSMSTHVPGGKSVCVHSVCVSPAHRRQGIASSLLKEYIARLERARQHERIVLIAHEELIPFYRKAGFQLLGKSDVVHGSRPWFSMRYDLSK